MKKILIFLLLLVSISGYSQLNLPFGVKVLNPVPLDSKYYNTSGAAYTNTAQVISQLTSGLRYEGLTVNVAGTEYWFYGGVADGDLVAKAGGSMVYPSAGLAKSTGSAWDTSITAGTGVETWLTTPSWTNFNSAITGTAPFWGLSGTSTLTSDVAIDGAYKINFGNSTKIKEFNSSSVDSTTISNTAEYVEYGDATEYGYLKLDSTEVSLNFNRLHDDPMFAFGLREAGLKFTPTDVITSTNGYINATLFTRDSPVFGSTESRILLDPYTIRFRGINSSSSTYDFLKIYQETNFVYLSNRSYHGLEIAPSYFMFNYGGSPRLTFDATGTSIALGSDATGDTYYRNSSGYFTRLPAGTNGHVLTLASGIPSWAAPSGGGGLTVGTTTITSGTDTYALYNNAGVLGNRAVTGTGNSVLSTSPTLVTPILGTPSSVTLTNATGLPPTTGISGWPANASGVLTNNGSGTLTWGAGGGSSSLSGLTVATATNTINNTNYQQSWQWSTLGSGTGLALSSSSTAAASNTQTLLSASLSGANATSTQTTYAGSFTNTHTGTASTNIAGYFKASGGTTNQGLIVEADNGLAGTPFQHYPIATFRRSTGVGAGIQLGYGTRGFSDPGVEAVGSIQAVGGTKLILGTPSYPKAIYVNDVGGVSLGGAADVNNIDATVNALLPIAFSTPTIAANTSRSSIYGSSSITGGTSGDFVIQSRSVAGKKIGLYTAATPTARLLAGDNGVEILNGKLTLTDAPTAATSSSDGILMRDVSTGEVKRLGIGQSLSIVSGNLSIRTTATKTVNETRATNYGVVGASASATSAIGVNAYYGNSTTLVVDVTVYGIKSDGSGSVTGKVTGRFRKDSSGTFTVDDAGTSTTSDVLILTSIVPEINSTNPQIKINTGASAAGYDFSFTAICSFITY